MKKYLLSMVFSFLPIYIWGMETNINKLDVHLKSIEPCHISYIGALRLLASDMNPSFEQLIDALRESRTSECIARDEFPLVMNLLEMALKIDCKSLAFQERKLKSYILEKEYSLEKIISMIEIVTLLDISLLLIPLLDQILHNLVSYYKAKQLVLAQAVLNKLSKDHKDILKNRLVELYTSDVWKIFHSRAQCQESSNYQGLEGESVFLVDHDCRHIIKCDKYKFSVFTNEGQLLYSLEFSHDGAVKQNRFYNDFFISIRGSSEIAIYQLDTGETIKTIMPQDLSVTCFDSFEILEENLVIYADKKIIILNLYDFEKHSTFEVEDSARFKLSISPDQSILAIAYPDHVSLYNLQNGTSIREEKLRAPAVFFTDEFMVIVHNAATFVNVNIYSLPDLALIKSMPSRNTDEQWRSRNDAVMISPDELLLSCLRCDSQEKHQNYHSHYYNITIGNMRLDVVPFGLNCCYHQFISPYLCLIQHTSFLFGHTLFIYDFRENKTIAWFSLPGEFRKMSKNKKIIICQDENKEEFSFSIDPVLKRFTLQELLKIIFYPETMWNSCAIL